MEAEVVLAAPRARTVRQIRRAAAVVVSAADIVDMAVGVVMEIAPARELDIGVTVAGPAVIMLALRINIVLLVLLAPEEVVVRRNTVAMGFGIAPTVVRLIARHCSAMVLEAVGLVPVISLSTVARAHIAEQVLVVSPECAGVRRPRVMAVVVIPAQIMTVMAPVVV